MADELSQRGLRWPRLVDTEGFVTLFQQANVEPRLAEGGTGSPEDVTPHTLRHSVFYWMFAEGDAKLKQVSLRLRHGSVATTERIYAHVIRR